MGNTIVEKGGQIILVTAATEKTIDENWTTQQKAEHAAKVASLLAQRNLHQTNVDLCQAQLDAIVPVGQELEALDVQSRKIKAPSAAESPAAPEKPTR
jgi:uncharacterized protein YfiM (DUF2279 family)